MKFIKSSLWTGVSVGAKTIGSIIVNKIIARFFLPSDFALISHFQNLMNIILMIPSDGINKGLVKYLSDKSLTEKAYVRYLGTAVLLNFIVFLIAAVGLFIQYDYLESLFITGNMSSHLWMALFLGVIVMNLISYFSFSILLSAQRVKTYVLLTTLSTFLLVGLLYLVALYKNFSLVLLLLGAGPALLFGFSLYMAFKEVRYRFRFQFSLGAIKDLSGFILMAASMVLFARVVEFVVRIIAFNEFSIYDTGLWQAVVKFSDYYAIACTSILSVAFYPKASELIQKQLALKKFVWHVLLVITPFSVISLAGIYFFKTEILYFFFDESFVAGAYLFNFQVIGDLFKVYSFVLGFLLSAQARIWMFIGIQALSAAVYLIAIYLLIPVAGLEGFSMAHAVRFLIYLLVLVYIQRKVLF
jgi:PST family polysaccharide transporter